jgi:glutamate/tyrosine decarboxylase-like PLP-dependent enzyme
MHIPFPEKGTHKEDILRLIDSFSSKDADWLRGRTFSLVFYPGEEVGDLVKEAYQRYFFENGLNPTVFKSLNRMENEVVSMTAALLHAPDTAAGNMTSGGTESIICAVKAAKKYAQSKNPNITRPNVVVPETIHPAFYKAADYFDLEVRAAAGKGESLLPDVNEMRALIDANTVLIAGSAPAYPHGIIDPLTEISALALEKDLWMHVDACVGGYMLPFLEQLGEPIPVFDFRLPGVSSISLDLHKYGYAAKGSSVVLYRNSQFRKNQFYVHTSWAGGLYASPSVSGTRPGGAIASSWAVLNHLGKEGYQKFAKLTIEAAHKIQHAINSTNGLKVVGSPLLTVFSFTSTGSIDIYRLGDELTALGWHLDRQLTPPSLHLTVSYGNVAFADEFVRDLAIAVEKVQANSLENFGDKFMQSVTKKAAQILPENWIKKIANGSIQNIPNQTEGKAKTAALYGLAGELSGSGALDDMLLELLDVMNKPSKESFENKTNKEQQ